MYKKIISLFVILFFSLFYFQISFASWTVLSDDNILVKAFSERKKKLFEVINWWELNEEIQKIELEINSIKSDEELNKELKKKLLNELKNLKEKIKENKNKLNKQDFEKFLKQAEDSIILKNKLLEKLNNQIEENKITKEKNQILLKKLEKLKQEQDKKRQIQSYKKYYIFWFFTLFLIILHFLLSYLINSNKIKKSKWVYIQFFLIFGYILFLIWFFFYLYPELSIFLIFISGYLLAINAHLIASFIWSIFILDKYKIWDVIRFWAYEGQITRITTINTYLLPMTKEWIFANKPIVIPNYKLLKDEVIKNKEPKLFLHRFFLRFHVDLELDILKLTEEIEQNILLKHLHLRLNTLDWNEEIYRTSIRFDKFWRIEIEFIWKWDDVLNKRIERKIMWLFGRVLEEKKKQKEEKELQKEIEKKQLELQEQEIVI